MHGSAEIRRPPRKVTGRAVLDTLGLFETVLFISYVVGAGTGVRLGVGIDRPFPVNHNFYDTLYVLSLLRINIHVRAASAVLLSFPPQPLG